MFRQGPSEFDQLRIVQKWAQVAVSTNPENVYAYLAFLDDVKAKERKVLMGSRTTAAQRALAQGALRMATVFEARANARLRTLGAAEYVFRKAGEPGSAFMGGYRGGRLGSRFTGGKK